MILALPVVAAGRVHHDLVLPVALEQVSADLVMPALDLVVGRVVGFPVLVHRLNVCGDLAVVEVGTFLGRQLFANG